MKEKLEKILERDRRRVSMMKKSETIAINKAKKVVEENS
jgi:hypothetical protein